MESWIKSVWVKRLLPFILIAAVWGGYSWWTKRSEAATFAEEHHYALATAKVWVATANYRNDEKRYLAYRDSVLAADGLSVERMRGLEKRYDHDPESALRFAAMIKRLVDSLITLENERREIKIDSTLLPD